MAKNYRKSRHVMIDLETLDTTPSSVVLSVGACLFSINNGYAEIQSSFSNSVEVLTQMLNGRTVSHSTLHWWQKQSADAKARVVYPANISSPPDMLDALDSWAKELEEFDYIWCQGGSFDFPILTDLYRDHDRAPFWKFWQERDCRTILGLGDVNRGEIAQELSLTQHDAADDCVLQAHAMARTLWSL